MAGPVITKPTIVPRPEHNISRSGISPNALKVLYRLRQAGYQAHLVGGGVRDLLLGREPKDFDIATDAHPEQVRAEFRNCRLIGRRFRLAHVHFGREIIEVATFRAPHDSNDSSNTDIETETESGRIVRDNVYGSIEEDARRRDLSINALYYNIDDFSIIDYAGGMQDVADGVIRLIGDPVTRYQEDPVRMLRVVRFAAKLGFKIDPATEAPLFEFGHLLEDVPPSRLFEEVNKLFLAGSAVQTFELMRHYGLFGHLFPEVEDVLSEEEGHFPHTFILRSLENTDKRIAAGKPVTPAFLFAALMWEPVRQESIALAEDDPVDPMDIRDAAYGVTDRQRESVAIPKRFQITMREIWELQPRFNRRNGKRALRLLTHPRFRAAYDFLCLRAQVGEASQESCQWWTTFQQAKGDDQRGMADAHNKPGRRRNRGGRRRKPKSKPATD